MPVRWKRTLCAAHRTRNSSLRVDSSPIEVRELAVVGVAAGLGAQVRDELRGERAPSRRRSRRRRVQEGEAGAVGGLLAALEHRRVQRAAERVGGEVVHAAVAHDRRRGHLVDDALHDRPDALLGRPRALGRRPGWRRARGRSRCARSASSSCSARASAFEHELGDAADVAALQALVVLDAHAGQRGDLLAAQARHAPLAVGGQAGLLRRDLRPARGEELGDVVGGVHGAPRYPVGGPRAKGCPVSTPLAGPLTPRSGRA